MQMQVSTTALTAHVEWRKLPLANFGGYVNVRWNVVNHNNGRKKHASDNFVPISLQMLRLQSNMLAVHSNAIVALHTSDCLSCQGR